MSGDEAPRRRADDVPPGSPGAPPPRGDEAELFERFHPQLVRLVGRSVNTAPEIVQEACAFAWLQFMRFQPDRDRAWKSWMITTAEREAWRLHRAEVGFVRSVALEGEERAFTIPDPHDRYADHLEAREALSLLAQVPERRRRAMALKILGYKYHEIAQTMGVNSSRANALLVEGTMAMRKERARRDGLDQPRSPRAVRLLELETRPPR